VPLTFDLENQYQRYFDAKSPYWPLQRVDERYPVEMLLHLLQ
jgi:hypothetical protein